MATTNNFTFGVDAHPFTLNFPFIDEDNLVVTLDGVVKTLTTDYTVINKTSNTAAGVGFLSGAQIQFNAPIPTSGAVRVVRNTTLETAATFNTGSAIRAKDLNSNFTQNLYVTEEISNNAVLINGSNAFEGNLNMDGNRIINLGSPASNTDAVNRNYVDVRFSDGVGTIPSFTRWIKPATSGQTVFTGTDSNSQTLSFQQGRESVFVNGALQTRDIDYTTNTAGTSITFTVGLTLNDVVDVTCVNSLLSGVSNLASDVQYTPAGTGAVQRTVESRLRDVVSVKDFGAAGDGVTDDTAAIQAAIDSLGEVTGGTVYFPAGTYKTSSNIEIKSKTTLQGDGRQSLIKSTSMTNLARGGQTQFYAIGKSDFNVVNLGFDNSEISSFTSATRSFYFSGCSNYVVQNNYFKESGAATASLACSDYYILDNEVDYSSTDGIAHHDGVFDQWNGSHHFVIRGNRIYGNSIALWPILATGTNSDGTIGTEIYDFVISENYTRDCKYPGIWAMGRAGLCTRFQIVNNIVENVLEREGIAITESDSFVVSGNVIKNTYWNSIRAYDEIGTATNYSARNGVISNNVCINANLANDPSGYAGSAITIAGLSQNISVTGNTVDGTNHIYAITCVQSPSNISISNECYTPGTTGTVSASSALNTTNIYPAGTTWISNPVISFGGNTPVNLRASRFVRSDKRYQCEGAVRINVTAPATNLVRITLDNPSSSTFASSYDVIGFAINTDGSIIGNVYASGTKIFIDFVSTGTGTQNLSYSFTYTLP
jgi:hypothetical protein